MNPVAQHPPGTLARKNQVGPFETPPSVQVDKTGRHPILPKQETITGHPMQPFGEELVIVYNPGPIAPHLVYDKKEYFYAENSSTTVPAVVAWFHFGVSAQNGRVERDKDQGSYAQDRFSSYCPLFLWQTQPEEYEKFKDWFFNKLKFKAYRPKVRVSSKEFDEIPGEAIS
jgi:hypothetical protein